MAKYMVKMISKTKVHKETSPGHEEPVVIIGFQVPEEEYADTVELPEKDFNMNAAWAAIREKLIKYEETSFTPVEHEVDTG